MTKTEKVLMVLMVANAIQATTSAFMFQNPLTIFVGYFSWSAAIASMKVIDPAWMYIYTDGNKFKFMRDLLLWPVTLYDYVTMNRLVERSNQIIAHHQAAGTIPSPKELKYINKMVKKTTRFTESYRRLVKERECSTNS